MITKTMNPHTKYLQAELEHYRKRLLKADAKNSPERGYLIGVIDGMVLVMQVIGVQATTPKKRTRRTQ